MTLPEPGPRPRPRPQPPQSFSLFTDAVLHVVLEACGVGSSRYSPGPATTDAQSWEWRPLPPGQPPPQSHRLRPVDLPDRPSDRQTDHRRQYTSLERCKAFAVTRTAVSPLLPAHSRCTDTPLYIPRNGTRGSSTLALQKIFTFYKCTLYDFNTLYSTSEHHQRRVLGLYFVFPNNKKNFGRFVKFCGKKKCPATRLLPLWEEDYASGWALGKKKCKWCEEYVWGRALGKNFQVPPGDARSM